MFLQTPNLFTSWPCLKKGHWDFTAFDSIGKIRKIFQPDPGLTLVWPACWSSLLVGGFFPPHLKNMRKSNWIMKPQVIRGENEKCLSCHHPRLPGFIISKIFLLPSYLVGWLNHHPSENICTSQKPVKLDHLPNFLRDNFQKSFATTTSLICFIRDFHSPNTVASWSSQQKKGGPPLHVDPRDRRDALWVRCPTRQAQRSALV